MEEKVLVKGVFGGKFAVTLLYILAAVILGILSIIDIEDHWDGELIIIGAVIAVIFVVFAIILGKSLKKRELIVTSKRVIARGAFGYRTDLAIENITSVSTYAFKGIGCASSSAKIKYLFCKNKMEIFDTISAEMLK